MLHNAGKTLNGGGGGGGGEIEPIVTVIFIKLYA